MTATLPLSIESLKLAEILGPLVLAGVNEGRALGTLVPEWSIEDDDRTDHFGHGFQVEATDQHDGFQVIVYFDQVALWAYLTAGANRLVFEVGFTSPWYRSIVQVVTERVYQRHQEASS